MKPKDDSGIEDNSDSEIPAEKVKYKVLDQTALVDRTLDQRLDDKRRAEYVQRPEASAPTHEAKLPSQVAPQQQSAKFGVSQLPSQITSQMSTQHKEDFTTRRHLDAAVSTSIIIHVVFTSWLMFTAPSPSTGDKWWRHATTLKIGPEPKHPAAVIEDQVF
jgi:hypothetical protein